MRAPVKRGQKLLDLAGDGVPARETLVEYKDNESRRDFAEDLVARVATISFAFERLYGLTLVHNEIWEAMEARRTQSSSNPVEIPGDLRDREAQADVEADAMTALIYYETSSVVHMLSSFNVALPKGSELEYVVKARDRFLVHPKLKGVTRRPNRGGAIPVGEGFLQRDAVSLNTLDYDRAAVDGLLEQMKGKDRNKERQKNEEIVRGGKWNERLSREEVTRIMAFGVREPNIERAMEELGSLLASQFLPVVEALVKEAVDKFGFENYPEGPTFSYRWDAFTGPS